MTEVTHDNATTDDALWTVAKALLLTDSGNRASCVRGESQSGEGGHGCGSGDTIDGKTSVALKIGYTRLGLRAEDTVDPTAVEAQAAEKQLQFCDVVASHHRRTSTQESSAEVVCGFVEGLPCLAPDNAAAFEASLALKRYDSVMGPPTEAIEVHGLDEISRKGQLPVEFDDGFADISSFQTRAGRTFIHHDRL